ncbi:MAG: hypothetical protein AB1810_03995 [Pseudomonadota bacterium]
MRLDKRLAILTISCDKYSSLWELFFDRFDRNWKDCSFQKYLLTNHQDYCRQGIRTLRIGDDIDWSSNLKAAIKFIEEDYILLMLEDAPLNGPVDSDEFTRILQQAIELDLNYLNMKASPRPPVSYDSRFGIYPPGLIYRTAVVPCIWKKSVLEKLLLKGESAWQFEIRGSGRSEQYDRFYALSRPFFNILHIIIQGQVDRRADASLRESGERSGIKFDTMSRSRYLKLRVKELLSVGVNTLPYKTRKSLRTMYFKHIARNDEWV